MATAYDRLVGQYLSDPNIRAQPLTPEEEARINGLAGQGTAALADKTPFISDYIVAAARQNNAGFSMIRNPVQRDLATLDNWTLAQKYGAGAPTLFNAYNTGSADYGMDIRAPSREAGLFGDGFNVAQGLVGGVTGLASLGAGLVNDAAGVWASKKSQDINQWFDSFKGPGHVGHIRSYSAESSLDRADTSEQYDTEKERDGTFIAGLRKIGRDAYDTAGRVWKDPEMFSDTVGQGAGSLLLGGPVAKGVGALGGLITRGAVLARPALLASELAGKAYTVGQAARVPLSVAAIEGGGAYQQTVQDAMSNLEGRTDLTQDQKAKMANMAGLEAAAIAAPIAGAIPGIADKLFHGVASKFISNPLRVPTISRALGNVAYEGVEEGIQSGTSQLAQNYAIRQNVDQTRDLTEGVGEQVATGAIGGLGAAGAIQAPGAVLGTAVGAAKLLGRSALSLGSKTMGFVDGRAQDVRDSIQAQSPVNAQAMDNAMSAAVSAEPTVRADAAAAVDNSSLSQEEKPQAQEYLTKLFDSVKFDDAEADNQPTVIGDAIRGSTDKFDAMRRVANIASDKAATPENRLSAGLYLADTIRSQQSMIRQVPEAIEKMDDADPALGQVRNFEDVMLNIERHPMIREAIGSALNFASSINEKSVSDQAVRTPEGQQAVQSAVRLASLAPEKTSPDVNKTILKHAEQGDIQLTPEQIGSLKTANALHEASARQQAGMVQAGLTQGRDHSEIIPSHDRTPAQIVSDEAQQKENAQGDLHLSAVSHLTGITTALDAGNTQLAANRLRHFVNFAQSMQSKVEALNNALVSGDSTDKNRTIYKSYNPVKGVFFDSKPGAYSDPKVGGVYLDGASRGSIANAQQIAVDADAVGYLANETAKAFPQLGVEPIELAKLHAAVSQTHAKEAAREYQIARRDGKLAEHLNLSEQTSPDRAPQAVLAETEAHQLLDGNKILDTGSSQTGSAQTENNTSAEQPADPVQKQNQSPSEQPAEQAAPVEPKTTDEAVSKGADEKSQSDLEQPAVEAPASQTDAVAKPEPASGEPALQAEAAKPVAPVQEADPVEADVKASGVDAAYPDLLGSNNGDDNIFKQAFDLPKDEPTSRLVGQENPIEIVGDALSSAARFRSHVSGTEASERAGGRLTPEVAQAYADYLKLAQPVLKGMADRLAKALSNRATKGKTLDLAFEELRALNIVNDGDEKTYNQELQQNAVIAGLQWLLTADQRQTFVDDEAVAKILGVPVTSVTTDQIDQFSQGVYLTASIQQLGDMIARYWGVKAKSDAPLGYVKGVPEGVAKEVIRGMEAAGLLKVIEIKHNGKLYYQVQFEDPNQEGGDRRSYVEEKLGKEKMGAIAQFPSAIEMVSVVEPEEATFVGVPPAKVAQTQLRNPLVRLTRQQTAMIENEQAVQHYPNLGFIDFNNSLGEDGAVRLYAHGDLDPEAMNANHLKSLESVNLTVRSAFRSIATTMAEVRSWADTMSDKGTKLSDVPVHYRSEFTSVNRLQTVGKHNPQANKVTREAFMPTRATVNLNNPENYGRFMLSLAQAWGVKVHKQVRDLSVRDAEKLARGQYAPAIEIISDWLTKNTAQKSIQFSDEQIDKLRETLGNGGPVSPAAMHAAIEYARFVDKSVDNSKFETSLYVEADGITDGPINAMHHTASGGFTTDWVNIMRKGGLYFGQPGMTSNRSSDAVDLYQHTTNALKGRVADMLRRLVSNAPVYEQARTLMRTMDRLLPDVSFDDATGDLELKRGVVKNPLTVSIYGSGAEGIAEKITEALMKSIYEMESRKLAFLKADPKGNVAVGLFGSESTSVEDAQRRYEEYHQDILKLFDRNPEYSDGGLNMATNKHGANKSSGAAFTFLPGQVQSLKANVLRLFVKPMREAIAGSIGETERGTTALRKATQVQGIYLKFAFQRAIQEKLEEKSKSVSGFKRSDFLSQKELGEIYDKLDHLAPYIQTGNQNMLVSGAEKSDIGNVGFSRDLTGKLSTPAYVYGPTDPGVSGIPYVVIGTGDGQMMQNYGTTPGVDPRHLLVFDGAHFPIDSALETQSRMMNEAVTKGWNENPLGAVSSGFADFVRDADLAKMDEAQRSSLSEALLGPGKTNMNPGEIVEEIKGLDSQLQDIAREVQARKNALNRVQFTVDHMASAEASFDANPEGESLAGLDDQQIADRLSKLYDEEHAKLLGNKADAPSENIKTELPEDFAIPAKAFPLFVAKLNVPEAQKGLLTELARTLRGSDWSILSGSPRRGINGENILGQTDFGSKQISIFNGSSETLLHEMIHAATLGQVHAFFTDPSSLTSEEREAVGRIEALMHDWLDSGTDQVSELNQEARRAMVNAQTTVMRYLSDITNGNASNKANAVNEFMAWVLSNQTLARVASNTKIRNPIAKIVGEALDFLKKLFNIKSKVGNDVYSNLRFNTSVLLRSRPQAVTSFVDTTLHQSDIFGRDGRLAEIERKIFNMTISNNFETAPGVLESDAREAHAQYVAAAIAQADATQRSFDAHGFPMDMQQASTFKAIAGIMATRMQFDPNMMSRIERLYEHVSKTITPETFREHPEVSDPVDEFQANERYNSVLGTHLVEIDRQGRSMLIPSFVALATVDDSFRSVLSKIDLPKGEKLPNTSFDNVLTNFGTSAMDNLDILTSGEGRNKQSVNQAMSALIERLLDVDQERKDFGSQFMGRAGSVVDTANAILVDRMQSLTQAGADKLTQVSTETSKPWVKKLAEVGKFGLGIFNKDIAEENATAFMELANKFVGSQTLHEFVNELVGRTRDNASVYDLIKASKSAIAQIRQQFREHLPAFLASRFDRNITDTEWQNMFRGLAKTDLTSLRSGYSVNQISEMIVDPAKMRQEASQIESRIAALKNGKVMVTKARELASYMRDGIAPHNLLRNAHAIERLLGEGLSVSSEVDTAAVKDIDHLVSLLSYEGLNQEDRDSLAALVQGDQTKDGLTFALSYLEGQRTNELAGVTDAGNETALYNHFKGYVPSIQDGKSHGRTLVVANDDRYAELVERGFTRVADYEGAAHDVRRNGRMGYYYSSLSGRSVFNQGIVQTVHATVSGVDPVTGYSSATITAGRIADPAEVARLQRTVSASSRVNPNERLMPVYDRKGDLVAYERSVDPNQLERLGRSEHFAHMMGVWSGRQVEEKFAGEINKGLIDNLHDIWEDRDKKFSSQRRSDEFVNLLDPALKKTDPVLYDAVKLIPRDSLAKIKELYGPNQFMVRRDMVNDTVGYRKASIGDAWTGNTRFSDETVKHIQNIAIGVFGKQAYKRLVQTEKVYQNFITDARVLIVVKSIIVPVANLVNNMYQLSMRGVPILDTVRGMPKKTSEVNAYLRGQNRLMEIEAEMRAAEGKNDVRATRRLTVERQSIKDGFERLSIKPLINAGEFSSISDVGLGKEEIEFAEGKLNEYMEALTNKLPDGVKTAGKYVIVAKDTALFKGLQRTVEYGDFLAKAILYDDLTGRQGKTSAEALAAITEEYVNYDRLAGRTRDYLENMGLTWFWNYKIRITKVALSMIRNNPLHALLTGLTPAPPFMGEIGSPIIDNFPMKAWDGGLKSSVGLGTGYRSHSLLPIVQLLG